MANAITKATISLPAHLQEAFGGMANDEFTAGVSMGYPVLSIKGKTFHIGRSGEVELVTAPDSDPDDKVPAHSLEVVILRANKSISKIYYEGGFEDGAAEKPDCYSNDGIAPADDVENKQSARCANCPQNQWGARITEKGKKAKACRDARRVAIAPAGNIEDAMLLRVPAASLKPLMVYGMALSKKGIPVQALVTRLSFDHDQAYPLLTFKHARLIDATQAGQVKEMMESDVVEAIINGTGGVTEFMEPDTDEEAEEGNLDAMAAELAKRNAAPAARKTAAPKPVAKPKPVVSAADVEDVLGTGTDDEDGGDAAAAAEQAAAAVAAASAAAKPKKPAATPKPKTAAAAAEGTVADDNMESALDKLLGSYDEE